MCLLLLELFTFSIAKIMFGSPCNSKLYAFLHEILQLDTSAIRAPDK